MTTGRRAAGPLLARRLAAVAGLFLVPMRAAERSVRRREAAAY